MHSLRHELCARYCKENNWLSPRISPNYINGDVIVNLGVISRGSSDALLIFHHDAMILALNIGRKWLVIMAFARSYFVGT